jgi:carbonic anhydrase
VCQTTAVADAWQRGQELTVHGWIYGLHDGRLRDLGLGVSGHADLAASHHLAVDRVTRKRLRPA